QFIAGSDQPLRALDSTFTYPVIGNFMIENVSLINLLGVRYLITDIGKVPLMKPLDVDWTRSGFQITGEVYDFLLDGYQSLSYDVWENKAVIPRAFVVPQAKHLQRHCLLDTLKSADFRSVVYLEDFDERSELQRPGKHDVKIRSYEPNRVVLQSNGQ